MDKKMIDVSQWNGTVNWDKVDCDGAIIRIAYRGYTAGTIKQDNMFLSNIQGATANDIPAGIYFMSQAINESEAIEEAEYTVNQIKDYVVSLPIFYDSELSGAKGNTGRADQLNKVQRTAICKAFCNRIEELGYQSGVYASTSWFKSNLDVSQLLDYYVWVAQYANACTATHRKDMWQYTSKGNIAGISGNVDISHCYTDLANTSSTNTLKTKETTIAADKSKATDIFKVKVTADSLRIRKGAGTEYDQVGSIRDKGVYTITKTISNWGYLKSGAGWICLDYVKKL
ncbi:GH25 family lysozyme [Lachnotalea glycerini]|uniref:Glycosyl hydrolase family 25 n=1 Tax=Lachnotalea glycerini TaxID=1763509 RepID=A0A371JBQ1_9FIRM|nr:glycoside hydrolase family 25 protein [Lachnotalea glycerini]RDY30153.1 hypothetical protein CG710_016060 [Lachnotalea glycerini]